MSKKQLMTKIFSEKKIQEGDVAGLDKIILADSKEFDDLLNELS